MTPVEKAQATLLWALDEMAHEQDGEKLERLVWFYKGIYQFYVAWKTPLLQYLN